MKHESHSEPPSSCHHDHRPLVGMDDASIPETRERQCHDAKTHHADHDSHHDHDHDHGGHSHSYMHRAHRPRQRRALLLCVLLTLAMMVVEIVGGILFGSLMLISDAIHMFSHATALGVSYFAVVLAQKRTTSRLSFGLYRVEILAAFVNGIGLAGFSLWIVWEAMHRIFEPIAVQGPEMTVVAIGGLLVNIATAVILGRAGLEDLNTKSAFLHMLADTFSSVAIVIGGVLISFTDWVLLDPILSMVVSVMIARWSWGLLRDSTLVLLEAKPRDLDDETIRTDVMAAFPAITDVHDLHIWEITSQYVCLTMHVAVEETELRDASLVAMNIRDFLRQRFRIAHVVVQVEPSSANHMDSADEKPGER